MDLSRFTVGGTPLAYGLYNEYKNGATHLVLKSEGLIEEGVYTIDNSVCVNRLLKEREDTAYYLIRQEVQLSFTNSLNLREKMDINEQKGKFKITLKGVEYIFNILGGKLNIGQLVQFDDLVFRISDITKPTEKGGKKEVVPRFLDVNVLEPVHLVRKSVVTENNNKITYIAGIYKGYTEFALASSGFITDRVVQCNLLPIHMMLETNRKDNWNGRANWNVTNIFEIRKGKELKYGSKGNSFDKPIKFVIPYVTTNVTDKFDGLLFATEDKDQSDYVYEKEEIPNYYLNKEPIILGKIVNVLSLNYKLTHWHR